MISKETFEEAMEKVDAFLQEQDVKIHARPIHAISELSKKLKISADIPITVRKETPLAYTPEFLATHIHNWYEKRYGERLKIHMGPGSIAILIKGTPWEMKFPKVCGSVEFICDKNISTYRNLPNFGRDGELPVYNVLLAIKNFPESLAHELTNIEQLEIVDQFLSCLDTLQSLSNHYSEPFIKEAFIDLDTAVRNLVGPHPHYGSSKWASLQFVEKVMKSRLKVKQIKFPNIHKLKQLAKIGKRESVFEVNEEDLSKIQCSAGTRYGDETVSLVSAMKAHKESVQVAGKIIGEKSFDFKH